MWISKKKYESLEKRIADLEKKIQSQQNVSSPHEMMLHTGGDHKHHYTSHTHPNVDRIINSVPKL